MAIKRYRYIAYQLTRPISFIMLRHESSALYNWYIPMFCALFFCVALGLIGGIEFFISKDGFLASVTSFLSGLPGFLIAALAAIATINRPMIDQQMPDAPKIDIWANNSFIKDHELTRREFLLRLFSFLTVESIFLILYVKIGILLAVPNILESTFHVVEWAYVGVFLVLFSQLSVLLLLGLYYLSERLNLNE